MTSIVSQLEDVFQLFQHICFALKLLKLIRIMAMSNQFLMLIDDNIEVSRFIELECLSKKK